MQADLFLTINLLNLLFPFLVNTVNTIGRYYLKTSSYFKDFYKTICEHLAEHYEYIRFISTHFIKNFSACENSVLSAFLKTIP